VENSNYTEVLKIIAPMAGTVVDMKPCLKPGLHISKGEELLTLERMKLFYTVSAPCTGTVISVMTQLGSKILEGEMLLEIMAQNH
jgi:biotin carboxyl carrier protein